MMQYPIDISDFVLPSILSHSLCPYLRLQLLAANMDSTHVFPLAVYVRVKSLTCAWLLVSCHNPKRIFLPLRQHVHNPVIIYNYKWNLSLNSASPHAFHCSVLGFCVLGPKLLTCLPATKSNFCGRFVISHLFWDWVLIQSRNLGNLF